MGHRVTVVHDSAGRLVAVKAPPADDPGRTGREAQILRDLRHPGVVEVVDPDADGPELHTRWVGARTAADLRRPLEPDRAAGLVLAVAATVSDLHQAGIVHGNLDPTHVLLDPFGRPVLCGFGDAERLDGPHGPRPSTDVAGLGALLATLLTDDDESADRRHPTPPRSWRRRPGRRRVAESRALLGIAEHATATDPLARPGLRAFIDALHAAAPEAALPPEDGTAAAGGRAPGDPSSGAPAIDALVTLLADPALRSGEPGPNRAATDVTSIVDHRLEGANGVARVLDDPRGADADESGFWDELERLRPGADTDRRMRRAGGWWGAGFSLVGLAIVGFLGMSAVTAHSAAPPEPPSVASPTAPSVAPRASGSSLDPPRRADTSPPSSAPRTATSAAGSPTTVDHNGRRYAVGEPGDLVAVADWRCDGRPTPALYRPRTGSLFVFDTWPDPGARDEIGPLTAVPDGSSLDAGPAGPDGCPTLVVRRADAPAVVLGREELR